MIAMEALDQLLMACHSQSIKPFVESFLHMVAKLLESREPDLQVLGTNSVRPQVEPERGPVVILKHPTTPLWSCVASSRPFIQPALAFFFTLMEYER